MCCADSGRAGQKTSSRYRRQRRLHPRRGERLVDTLQKIGGLGWVKGARIRNATLYTLTYAGVQEAETSRKALVA
jgi:hypothetical protein